METPKRIHPDVDKDPCWMLLGDGPSLLLERCPDGVDHCIADFPYSTVVYKNARKTPGVGTYKGGNTGLQAPERDLGHAPLTEDLQVRTCEVLAARVHRWSLLFSDLEGAERWRQIGISCGLNYVRTGIWHKDNGQPQLTGDRPGSGCEAIVIFHGDAPMEWNGGGHDAFWESHVAPPDPERHPVEKPLDLMRVLVEQFTKRGDLVADITAGRATTGVAALSRGRKFFGVELDPVYHDRGARRLARDVAREQYGLFG